MLSVENISLVYDRPILHSISFDLEVGKVLGLVGRSGAGKTSLLKVIAGLADATEGNVFIDGDKVLGPTIKLVPGHDDIQLVNQDFGLSMYQSVSENIREKIHYLTKREQYEFTDELLELVELNELKDQKAHLLSGGEQQRLAIARALACEPKLLLLDEPFVHLDTRLRMKITSFIMEMKKVRNMSLILVSHDGNEVLGLSDEVIFLKEGKIKRKTIPQKAYYNYQSLEEGELYNWVNSVQQNKKRVLFRPDEYSLQKKDSACSKVRVEFIDATFHLGQFLNRFKSSGKKPIYLVSQAPLKDVTEFYIQKKST